MAYQTLLAHLPIEEDVDAVLDVATTLAERHSAHLIGLHVIPRLDLQYSYEIPVVMTREFEAQRRAVATKIGERFAAATNAVDFVADWHAIESGERSTEQLLIEYGNTADLIIAAQTREVNRRGSRGELTARVLAGSGRPVLLVPPEREVDKLGEQVFVAWDGQRASTRALFAALPLLARAGAVRLQRINAPSRDRNRALGATEEVADTLARHGVNVEVFHADARDGEIGHELIGYADDWGADLIVTGCQEQGALREFLLGSTTRHLLEHTRVPVLMSH